MKTDEAGDAILVDMKKLSFLNSVLAALAQPPTEEPLLGMSYLEYLKMFSAVCWRMGVSVVPSMGRRGGASIDAALQRRTLLEI